MDAALPSIQQQQQQSLVSSAASADINYRTTNSAASTAGSSSTTSRHSGGSSSINSSGGPIRHSDTQFDSSADETVIPYMIGERSSREFASNTSIERFDPEASPKSHLSHRLSRRSIDTEQCCGTLYEETLDAQLILPANSSTDDTHNTKLNGKSQQHAMGDTTENIRQHSDDIEVEPHESQHLVSDQTVQSQDNNHTSTKSARRPLFSARLRGKWLSVRLWGRWVQSEEGWI